MVTMREHSILYREDTRYFTVDIFFIIPDALATPLTVEIALLPLMLMMEYSHNVPESGNIMPSKD